MSYVSKQLLRPVIAVVLALGIGLPAVGGTMAHEEDDTATTALAIDSSSLERNTNDLRGKLLRITPTDDGG